MLCACCLLYNHHSDNHFRQPSTTPSVFDPLTSAKLPTLPNNERSQSNTVFITLELHQPLPISATMTQFKTYLHHYERVSNNTHHHYYTDPPCRYSNIDPRQPSDPSPPSDAPPDPDRARRRWIRTAQRAATALSLSSDDELTPPNSDRAQRSRNRRAQRAADARSLSSSDDGESATSSAAAELLPVNIEERAPRVYEYRGSELANPASTLRHGSIPANVRLRGGAEDEALPVWFLCAGSKAARRVSVAWAALEADKSMKEDLGFEERETMRGRRRSRSKRRDSSASAGARSEVVEHYLKMLAAAQAAAHKDKKSREEQVRADSMAAMFEQTEEYRKALEAALAQQSEARTEAASTPDLDDWLQWQKLEAMRRAAFKRMGKAPDWERSLNRQYADFEQWQKKMREKSQQKEYIRLRGKEKALVRRSNTKRPTGLPSLLKTHKAKKMDRTEVNDVEWMDVPTFYEDSERWR